LAFHAEEKRKEEKRKILLSMSDPLLGKENSKMKIEY